MKNTSLKEKLLTAVSTLMLFIPWTIFLLRTNAWALESPAAEIIISAYALFMIVSAVFTIDAYVREKIQNNLMKICLIINSLYGAVGIVAFCLMAAQKFSQT